VQQASANPEFILLMLANRGDEKGTNLEFTELGTQASGVEKFTIGCLAQSNHY
jgi:hypothetical protein